MKKLIYWVIIFLGVPVFLFPQKIFAAQYAGQSIFYLAKYNAVAGVASVNQHWQDIDILAPQYYTVGLNFLVSGSFGPQLKAAITAHHIKVMPLISNANFNQNTMHQLLSSSIGQALVIDQLLELAKTQNYIGWQFDFEHISYQDKDLYSAFVAKAYQQFQQNNLQLSVAVLARTDDNTTTDAYQNWSGAYDYQSIGSNCDFVSLMAYDDPNSVGPVASLPFDTQALNYAEQYIPAAKISLGIPLYYWKWQVADNKKIGSGFYKNILAIEDNYRYTTGLDQNLGVSWLDYTFGAKEYKIWFEDQKSFGAKLQLVQSNHLQGFSAWLIGGEDPAIWNFLSTAP